MTGFGCWDAEEGLRFFVQVQEGNVASAFQTQKLEAGLKCTLIRTFNKWGVPK